ncbi:hypothetical protein COF68_04850 [Bacillus toyonensis]|uniref:DUF7018 domain-containing (lipo)protein n=1 Tax=Bacillus toyonensis TaxID=155322 RepID=UPI000BFD594C|nr:hypothetical protein [Bacillus toyonensis]PHE64179.1 hypothetical protein COF68_04850 [Bacillus toyonensis]
MKRKALTLAIPFMLLTGVVGCESNAIDEDHAIVSKEDAKKEDIYAGNLMKLNTEFGTVLNEVASLDTQGTSSSSKEEFTDKLNELKSITAQMKRLKPGSKYKDSHKKVSESASMFIKAFDKELDAIDKEDSKKLSEGMEDANKASELYLEGFAEADSIYVKEVEDIAENLGK